ncbi:MAG: ABC transporter ATP-binding protein [Brochothrix thermosphacta]|uniref:ABC transporter ATP-binding protein n=1 Tax=Brochothrix thermosphacta TaxID=2756 RepID=UPI003F90082B
MDSNTVLSLDNITKRIKRKDLVKDVNFSLQKGEILGLLGPNGSGKTTIMRQIVGLTFPTSGSIVVLGETVRHTNRDYLKHIGAIIENPEFYNYMTGYQNLQQFLRLSDYEVTTDELDAIIEKVHLTDSIHNKVKTYSLGMRQRLGVAQAILHNPSVLILDEPTNGLDPQGVREFRELLKELAQTSNVGILISSHLLNEIEQICTRLLVLENGVIIKDESLDSMLATTQTVRLTTNDNHSAKLSLETLDYVSEIVGLELIVTLKSTSLAEIIRTLVNDNIDIITLEHHRESLEDNFIKLTNHKGGH